MQHRAYGVAWRNRACAESGESLLRTWQLETLPACIYRFALRISARRISALAPGEHPLAGGRIVPLKCETAAAYPAAQKPQRKRKALAACLASYAVSEEERREDISSSLSFESENKYIMAAASSILTKSG